MNSPQFAVRDAKVSLNIIKENAENQKHYYKPVAGYCRKNNSRSNRKDVLKQAQTGLDSARAAREQNQLLSPISGVISNVVARAGEVAQPGTALVNVISLEGMRIEALVLTRQLRGIHIGQQAKISLDTLPGKVFTSIITEISRFAEPDGRSFRVKFRIVDPPYLHPGQTARISLQQ